MCGLSGALQTPVVENGSGECDVGSDDVRHGTGDGDMPGGQDEEPSTTVTLNMPPVLTKKVMHAKVIRLPYC